jgi:hypothetical protein
MKRMLEHLINVIQKEEMELMFGKGSKIVVESISYSTNAKSYVVHSKVFATEVNDSVDIFPTGLNMLIDEGWKYTGVSNDVTKINTLDVL